MCQKDLIQNLSDKSVFTWLLHTSKLYDEIKNNKSQKYLSQVPLNGNYGVLRISFYILSKL